MGVLDSARGRKAGEFLLDAMIARARAIKIKKLYLLTNSKCAAAVHLYEKAGFVHDATIMADNGARYERCNVAMSFPIQSLLRRHRHFDALRSPDDAARGWPLHHAVTESDLT
jgi:N-acetylglutamate synthase-like GNAT family acetyltransferase